MKRVDLLIDEVREETGNTEYSSETGVQDSTILRAFNDAQTRIMSLIQQSKPNVFQKEEEISAVANQEAYDLPVDIFASHLVEKVEYSPSGDARDYYTLDEGVLLERQNGVSGQPCLWIRRSSKLLLNPKPTQAGLIRVTYIYTIPQLDKRRGVVSAVTLDSVNRQITALTLDPTALPTDNSEALNDAEYFCVLDRNGEIKMQAVPIDDLNTSSGVLTVDPDFVYDADEAIEVGDYVVAGKFHTTHSQLPDVAERYLLAFGKWRAQKQDSSNDSQEGFQEKSEMESDIVATYSVPSKGVAEVPILDTQFL